MGETTTTTTCGDQDDDLPLIFSEDVLIKILLCLPVKSLLRFKSICKSWLELILTPFFIDLHTTITTFNSFFSSSSKFGAFIIQTAENYDSVYGGEIKLFKLSYGYGGGGGTGDDDDEDDDQNQNQNQKKKMVFKVDDLGFYPFYKDTQMGSTLRMVGSCNGIICLHDPILMDVSKGGGHRQYYSNLRDVCLWNPATRQFRILPKSIPIEEKQRYMGNWLEDFIAFGFDIKTKDYKVLRINPWHQFDDGGCMCRAQVYSLSTDSWRLLENINSLPVTPSQSMSLNSGIYHLNGSYFFGNFYLGNFRLSFDFTKEIFYTMGYGASMNNGFWTKLLSYGIKSSGEETYTEPRCISNNGEFALISTGRTTDDDDDGYSENKLRLFNLVTKEAIKDFTIGNRECRANCDPYRNRECRANVYEESLVSIMGGGNVL